EQVGIDGSFFKGSAGQGSITTQKQAKQALVRIETDIAAYLQELDKADQTDAEITWETSGLTEKLAQLRQRQQDYEAALQEMEAKGATQTCRTDPDARRLQKHGKKMVGYNVQ